MQRIFLLFFSFFTISAGLSAQDYVTENELPKRLQKRFEAAKKQYVAQQADVAAVTVKKILEREPAFIDGWLFYADLLLQEGQYKTSEEAFQKAVDMAPAYTPLAYYWLATAEMQVGQFAEAEKHLTQFMGFAQVEGKYKVRAERLLEDATFAARAVEQPIPFEPQRLSSSINTEHPEYLPSISADGASLVYTRRASPRNEDIYYAQRSDTGWAAGQPLRALNTLFNDSSPSMSADGQAMAFARNDERNNFDIYFATRQNSSWQAPKRLPAPVNTGSFESQPSLSANGKELFFVSDRVGGKGRLDIWMCERLENGEWGRPQNLGDSINTELNEQAPFLHPDGQTLYFMSKGHPGMGQYDLYLSRRKADGSWSRPFNLGYPINTPRNEGAIIVSLDGQTAYFDSDQENPIAPQQEMGDADIFSFRLYPEAQPTPATYVQAKVRDADTKRPLEADVEILRLQGGQLHTSSRTDERGRFLAVLPVGEDYALNVMKTGYLFHSENFALREQQLPGKPYELLIELEPIPEDTAAVEASKPIVLNNVFFDTGSAQLRSESAPELNRLAALLEEYPDMYIQINGHTDNVGQPEDNKRLSQQRAKAVYEYLIQQGIEQGRLSYKGFGESRPVADNERAEGRQRNRRTEFEVVKKQLENRP